MFISYSQGGIVHIVNVHEIVEMTFDSAKSVLRIVNRDGEIYEATGSDAMVAYARLKAPPVGLIVEVGNLRRLAQVGS